MSRSNTKLELTEYLYQKCSHILQNINIRYSVAFDVKIITSIPGFDVDISHDDKRAGILLIARAIDSGKSNPFRECMGYFSGIEVYLILHYSSQLPNIHVPNIHAVSGEKLHEIVIPECF